MTITKFQRSRRRQHIGASDAPAVLGLSPWQTQTDVYWSKVAETPEEPTEAMQIGNRLESPLIQFGCESLGIKAKRNQFRVAKDRIIAASLDALVIRKPEALECKFVGPAQAQNWGEPWTDQIPDHVNVQCQVQMYAANLERVWLPVAVAQGRLDWRIYGPIERHEGIIAAVVERLLAWWRQYVIPRLPPDELPPPLEVLRSLRRQPGSVIDLDQSAIDAVAWWEATRDKRMATEVQEDNAKAKVIGLLGDSEAGRLPDGRMIMYTPESAGARLDLDALRAEEPEVWRRFSRATKRRVLRIKGK